MNKENESAEALMRIVVGIVSGVIIGVWKMLVIVLAVINFVLVLFTGKRDKEIANFCEIWNTQLYLYSRYLTFVSNERPFPFKKMPKNISKFE